MTKNNNYWQNLVGKVNNFEEDLRKETWGKVASDSARKIVGRESYYEQEAREENERYWADYSKNTGIKQQDIKYPNRVGSDWNHPTQDMPAIGRPMKMLYGGMR